MSDNKEGRPTLYKSEYCQQIIDYFSINPYRQEKLEVKYKDGRIEEKYTEIANDLPLFSRFAVEIGVHRETLLNWSKEFPEFFDAYKKAKELQRAILITNGLRNNYQSTFAIFTAKNLTDMRDEQDIKHSGEINFIKVTLPKDLDNSDNGN